MNRSSSAQALLSLLIRPETDDQLRRVIVLDGPIGIGKSALLHRVLPTIRGEVFLSRPNQLGSSSPLDGLRGIIEAITGEPLDAVLAKHSTVPCLVNRLRDEINDRETVWVIDDADALDQTSIDLLAEVASTPGTPGDLVLAMRSGRLPAVLSRAITRSGATLHRVSLTGLPPEEAIDVLAAVPASHHPQILEIAEGNPLFLRLLGEVATRLNPDQLGDPVEMANQLRNWSLDDTLRLEVEQLGRVARRVVEAAAVAGRLDPGLLATLTDLDASQVDEAVGELTRQQLLTTDLDGTTIVHPLFAAAAYRAADPCDRSRLHRRLATAAGIDLLSAARNLALSGGDLNEQEAALVMAGAELIMATSPRTTIDWLRSVARSQQRDLLAARALIALGSTPAAMRLLQPLVDNDQPDGQTLLLAMYGHRMLGDLEQARALARRAALSDDPAVIIEITSIGILSDDPPPLDQIVALADDTEQAPHISMAAHWLASLQLLESGDHVEGRRRYHVANAVAAGLPAESVVEVIDAFAACGWAGFCLGDHDQPRLLLERAIEVAHRFGRSTAIAHLQAPLAFHYVQLGELDLCDEVATASIAASSASNWPDTARMARAAQLNCSMWRGDPNLMRQRWQSLGEGGMPTSRLWGRTTESLWRRVGAVLGLGPAVSWVDEWPDPMVAVRQVDAGHIALTRADHREADLFADAALVSSVNAVQRAQALLVKSRVARAADDLPRASELAGEAVALLQPTTARLHLAAARAALAKCSRQVDEASLTPREREVATLVARGMTNRDIAQELVISPRTVEDHVARILRKHDLAGRAAIGSLLR